MGDLDSFIARVSPFDGSVKWVRSFGGMGKDLVFGLVSNSSDIFVAGMFEYQLNLGTGPMTSLGTSDVFIADFSAVDGSTKWAQRIGGTDLEGAGAIVASDSAVVVGGVFRGVVDFGGGARTAMGTQRDGFVAKYAAADGSYVWDQELPSPTFASATALAMTSSGDVIVGGSFIDDLLIGVPPGTSMAEDFFLASFSGSTGARAWSKAFVRPGVQSLTSLSLAPTGMLYVGGRFDTSFTINTTTLTPVGGVDGFVIAFMTFPMPSTNG